MSVLAELLFPIGVWSVTVIPVAWVSEAHTRSLEASHSFTPIPQFLPVEPVFGLDGIIELGGGYNAEQAVVIGLLYAFQLELYLVALPDGFFAAFFIGRLLSP